MTRSLIIMWFVFSAFFAFSAMTGMLFLYTQPSVFKFTIVSLISITFGFISTYVLNRKHR
jgi:hypothetical protein